MGGGDVGGTVVVITEGMSEAVSLGVCPGFKESDAKMPMGGVVVMVEGCYAKGNVLRL